jgi:hypothetical protein
MRKIAIILTSSRYDDYDNYHMIINSITDWQEVSEEDYRLLDSFSYVKDFTILEQPIAPKDYIGNTIAEFRELARKQKEEDDARILAEEKKKQARAEKKILKEAETRKALFEKLQAEFGSSSPVSNG